jgi:hypothetical protein
MKGAPVYKIKKEANVYDDNKPAKNVASGAAKVI